MSTPTGRTAIEGSGSAGDEWVGVAGSAGVVVGIEVGAAPGDVGAEEVGDLEATELLHPAAKTAALSNAMAR